MRKQTLERLDKVFRHYVRYCIAPLAGGVMAAVVFKFAEPDTPVEVFVIVLSGMVIGTIICLILMRILKTRLTQE